MPSAYGLQVVVEGVSRWGGPREFREAVLLPQRLVSRMLNLKSREWVFESRNGTPVNLGNALRRYIRPAVRELGIILGGWHDARHTLSTTLRRNGIDPRVRSNILGHSVSLALDVYDHPDVSDLRATFGCGRSRVVTRCYKKWRCGLRGSVKAC